MFEARRFSSLLCISFPLAQVIAGCSAHAVAPPEAPHAPALLEAAPAVKSTADIVAAALPAVVLLINERPGKNGAPPTTTYGAGFLTRDGLVVTSLHVVDGDGKLSAMLHEPGRRGYTPMDGGLSRFLFENQDNLVPAERVANDGVADLAVVKVLAETSHLPKLVWSQSEVRAGDRVLALGHPQETVWSFSEGVVGALQHGVLQHDAIVGPGSSGGPLLDARGEVIGVNIARVVNQPAGLSFARPIAMVASTFSEEKVASPLDQSTPEAAAISCWRAQQLALPETADCFDWETEWTRFESSAEEAKKLAADDAARERIGRCFLGPEARARWIASEREDVVRVFDPTFGKKKDEPHEVEAGDAGAASDEGKARRSGATSGESTPEKTESADPRAGFLADYHDPQRLARRLRNGLRTEGSHAASADLAWVLLASRAADGTVDRFSELYVRVQGRWVQRVFPTSDELQSLPAEWPRPPMTWAQKRPAHIASILKKASTADPCPHGASDAASSAGGSGRAVLRAGFSTDL